MSKRSYFEWSIGKPKFRRVGDVTVVTRYKYDDDGYSSLDWLGRFTDDPKSDYAYFRREGIVRCPDGSYRDERGRYVAEPERNHYAREFQWIDTPNADSIAYCVRDARHLEAFNNGDWCMIGIEATVRLDGAEIGYASCWGIESDSDDGYIAEMTRQLETEAIHEARAWLARRKAA